MCNIECYSCAVWPYRRMKCICMHRRIGSPAQVYSIHSTIILCMEMYDGDADSGLGCSYFKSTRLFSSFFFSRNEDFTVQSWLVLLFDSGLLLLVCCRPERDRNRQREGERERDLQVDWNAGCWDATGSGLIPETHRACTASHSEIQDKCCWWWFLLIYFFYRRHLKVHKQYT